MLRTLVLTLLAVATVNVVCYSQSSFVIPPGFEEVEGDLFTGGYPNGFHFQQLAEADWFGDLPDGPQAIERISFRPKNSVVEPLDLAEAHLTLRLSTNSLDELGLTYANNHGPDVATVFDGPIGITSQAPSSNGVTRDFDVHFDLMEPFLYDKSQGNLVFDFLYQPIDNTPIPDSLTDFTAVNYGAVTGLPATNHHVSHNGPPQAEAVTALPGGNIYQVTFADPNPQRQPIFTRKLDVGRNLDVNEGIAPPTFEFVPAVSADGLTMLFSATETPSGVGGEDMYMATRDDLDSPFGEPVNLRRINSTGDDDVGSLSSDGLTVYFGSNRGAGRNWDMYSATRPSIAADFGNPELLPGPVNTDIIENSPRISADDLTLVYHSGIAGTDRGIWIATRETATDEFATPRMLHEFEDGNGTPWWPNLSSNGLVLITSDQPSSQWPNRTGGEGGEDIWVSIRDSVDEPFSAPQNPDEIWPGTQINSANRSAYPFLSPDWPEIGSKLYFIDAPSGTGGANASIYQMTWMIPEDGDVNLDGWENADDLNDMCRQIRRSREDMQFDINEDGVVTLDDMQLLQGHLEILPGDSDIDGNVDFQDFLTLSNRFGRNAGPEAWTRGDFDCSGKTDFADFQTLSKNFGTRFQSTETASVPEPFQPIPALVFSLLLWGCRTRQR